MAQNTITHYDLFWVIEFFSYISVMVVAQPDSGSPKHHGIKCQRIQARLPEPKALILWWGLLKEFGSFSFCISLPVMGKGIKGGANNNVPILQDQ